MLHRCAVITVTLLAIGMSVMAEAADPVVTDADRLKASLAKWEKARDESRGDYSYQVRWNSFAGFGHTTTIRVQGNKVVERTYEEFGPPQPVKPGETPAAAKWVETGKDVGVHKNEGAVALTVDELYAEATKLLDRKVPEHHKLYLGFDKQGLLSHCFIVDTRIADDAPTMGVGPIQIRLKLHE